MLEIEVKILDINEKVVEERLKSLGAELQYDDDIESLYFDFPHLSLPKGHTIRLRRQGEVYELTLKKKISNEKAKIRDETEITVSDFESARIILEDLGLRVARRLIKHRKSFLLDGVHFEIDTLPGIPCFLEIEAENIKKIEQYAALFGYRMEDTRAWSTKDVLRYYGNENNLI